jgi:hypothetical protein
VRTPETSGVTTGSAGDEPTDPAVQRIGYSDVPEFPTLLLPYLDLAGTAVFATSGALAAARARQTPLTFAFFAIVTGIGGNTLTRRCLLVGERIWRE